MTVEPSIAIHYLPRRSWVPRWLRRINWTVVGVLALNTALWAVVLSAILYGIGRVL